MTDELNDLPEFKKAIDWWSAKTEYETRNRLLAFYDYLRQNDAGRLELINRHLRMYGNMPVSSGGTTQYGTGWYGEDRMRLNVVKSAVDTVTAKITKNKPLPKAQTSGGNWSLQRKARFLEKFFEAQFYISGVDQVAVKSFMDCAVMGTGCMKVHGEGKEVKVERVFPGELFVDEQDGLYGDPRMIVQRKFIDREVLKQHYPKHKAAIAVSKDVDDHAVEFGYDNRGDQVLVLEAWRRPSKKGGKDGRHVIVVDQATLVNEEWAEDLPFAFIRWSDRPRGFWGSGLAEELTGIQVEINRLLQKIQAAMHLVSVPRVFVEEGSKVQKAYLNNKVGMIVPYRGSKPIFEVPQSVHQEMFNHLTWLYNKAFEIAGISLMNTGAGRPAELSGVALNTYHDIETERFATVAIAWEQMHLAVAKQLITVAKKLNLKVVGQKDKHTIFHMPWRDISMDEDAYTLGVESASALPSTPAGRMQYVQQLIQAGIIADPAQARRLLRFPDLEADEALDRAALDNIKRIVERILDEGQYESPEPYMDLDLALKIFQSEYNIAVQYEDMPEENLELMRRFMRETHRMLKAAMAEQQALQQAPAAGAPPPPGPDGAPPTAVGQSDGVPQA